MKKNNIMNDLEKEKLELLSAQKFIILSIVSFSLYSSWWMYKSWRFLKVKDNLDILPVARTIFAIFFLNSLFNKIQDFSKSKGYLKSFSSSNYFVGFFVFQFIANLDLPDPFWMVSLLGVFFLIPAVESLNYGIKNSGDYTVIENGKFNNRQIVLTVIGSILWIIIIIGLFITV